MAPTCALTVRSVISSWRAISLLLAPLREQDGGFLFARCQGRTPRLLTAFTRRREARGRRQQTLHEPAADPDTAVFDDHGDLPEHFGRGMAVAVTGGAGSQCGHGLVLRRPIGQQHERASGKAGSEPADHLGRAAARRLQDPDDAVAKRRRIQPAGHEIGKGLPPVVPLARVNRKKNRRHRHRSDKARALARSTGFSKYERTLFSPVMMSTSAIIPGITGRLLPSVGRSVRTRTV